jgi:phosphoribosylformylglycinamidine synthase
MEATAMSRPRVAVLHAPGTNRDGEAVAALEQAGGTATIVPVGRDLGTFAAVVVPGGFSYGDALGAGTRLALDVSSPLSEFAASGRPVLGICNGFQALVKAGLLPGADAPPSSETCGVRRVTLAHNANGRFECRWVHLAPEPGSRAALNGFLPPVIACPVAHGEGRLVVDGPDTADALASSGQVLFRYVAADGTAADGRYPENPNGSAADIAGLCNPAGNVWGLMPHPEDHIDESQDPYGRRGRLGLALFEALVERARAH